MDDYVIIHLGYAIGKIDTEEVPCTLALFAELVEAQNTLKPLQNMLEVLEIHRRISQWRAGLPYGGQLRDKRSQAHISPSTCDCLL